MVRLSFLKASLYTEEKDEAQACRKRTYEAGYERVRSVIWKTFSVHTEVYEEWMTERESCVFKDNSSFARFLLERAKSSGTAVTTSAVSESLPTERCV